MTTELKELERWCCKQIELRRELASMPGYPGVVECTSRFPESVMKIQMYVGIEKTASALKLPVHIELNKGSYEKSVTHLGVKFFQIGFYD